MIIESIKKYHKSRKTNQRSNNLIMKLKKNIMLLYNDTANRDIF